MKKLENSLKILPLEERIIEAAIHKWKAHLVNQDLNSTEQMLLKYHLALEVAEKEVEYYKQTKSWLRNRLKYLCNIFRNGELVAKKERYNKALEMLQNAISHKEMQDCIEILKIASGYEETNK